MKSAHLPGACWPPPWRVTVACLASDFPIVLGRHVFALVGGERCATRDGITDVVL